MKYNSKAETRGSGMRYMIYYVIAFLCGIGLGGILMSWVWGKL